MQSELIHQASLVSSNEAGSPELHLPHSWKGLPLNLYRGHARAEQGPSHVAHPMLILGTIGQCHRCYRQNGKNVETAWLPGSIDLLGSDYQRERARWEGTPGQTVGLHLTAEAVNRLVHGAFDFDVGTKLAFNDPKLQWLAQELLGEAQRGEQGNDLYVESLSCVLITRLAKCYGNRKAVEKDAGGLSATNRCRVIDFIEANLGANLNISILAKEVSLSPHHFSHCFAASFCQTPHQYVMQRRIEEARRMLKTSSKSLTAIAMDLGFSSHAHFSQVFREHTGLTPSRARTLQE